MLPRKDAAMIALLNEKRNEIADLCRTFGIRKLEVFGSAATGAFDPETSDIDFIVDLGGYERGVSERYFRFAEALESLLGYDVDLLTEENIQNPYFRRSVERSREPVYERTGDQAVA